MPPVRAARSELFERAFAMCSLVGWLVLAAPPASAADDPASEPRITAGDRDHWAYRPLVRPPVPDVSGAAWPRNAIDRFIIAKLEAAGLAPLPEAGRVTLIRRVTFDLTGLPPTPEEIDRFVHDPAADAYERLVDRLLASDACGARQAQHWLDLARFAETDGFEHDHVRPSAWRYRDWVIEAFNADRPWDEFVKLQVAGDVLRPGDPSAAVATGFLLCGPDMPDINLDEERRHNFLNDMTSTVGSVFLGLQVGCAQCHDHKYDAISQLDFYRLRAFFDRAEIFREFAIAAPAERQAHERAAAERERRSRDLTAQVEQLERAVLERVRRERGEPELRLEAGALLDHFTDDEHRRRTALTAGLERLGKEKPPGLPMGRVVRERTESVEPSFLRIRGDFARKGPRIDPAFPRIANPAGLTLADLGSSPGTDSARAALAIWLTRPDNPLVPRVLANRLWQHHFTRGLSDTPSDFGVVGDEPSHPELLDWLAAELAGTGSSSSAAVGQAASLPGVQQPASEAGSFGHAASLKRLHRLIVTSATYRQASRFSEPEWSADDRSLARQRWQQAAAEDPENRLLWRMPRRRLEGEAIRDTLLAVSDSLSQRRGGPGVRPPLPDELVSTLLRNQWPVTPEVEDHHRRSIYLFVRRNLRYPLFEVFDRPDTNASCARRNRSTIAPQALVLLNSEQSLESARALAARVLREAGGDTDAQIARCYRLALARTPTAAERALAAGFLRETAAGLRAEGREPRTLAVPERLPADADPWHAAALTDLCLAVFNLNEFVYVD